jgi:hypothetical protein
MPPPPTQALEDIGFRQITASSHVSDSRSRFECEWIPPST